VSILIRRGAPPHSSWWSPLHLLWVVPLVCPRPHCQISPWYSPCEQWLVPSFMAVPSWGGSGFHHWLLVVVPLVHRGGPTFIHSFIVVVPPLFIGGSPLRLLWVVPSFICCGGPPHSLCVVLPSIIVGGAPLAPVICPASSGSQGWGRVLGCSFVPTLQAGARSSGGGGWLSSLFGPW
jgi:hypothetical protein